MEKSNKNGFKKALLRNPVERILAITSLIAATYFWYSSREYPELCYSLSSTRTNILKTGSASNLKVFHGDREITDDLTAVQIVIWNSGKKPIEMADTLSPIHILTEPKVAILEVTIQDSSRKEIKFRYDDSLFNDGVIPVSWRVLEKDDGVLLQVIYEGPSNAKLSLSGSLIKQRSPRNVSEYKSKKSSLVAIFVLVVFLLASAYGSFAALKEAIFSKRTPVVTFEIVFKSLSVLGLLGGAVYLLHLSLFKMAPLPTIPFNF